MAPRCQNRKADASIWRILMNRLATLTIILATAWPITAQQPAVVNLWPGKPPNDVGIVGDEKFIEFKQSPDIKWITNVTEPTLTLYRPPADQDTRAAMLIAPGGGYHNLA